MNTVAAQPPQAVLASVNGRAVAPGHVLHVSRVGFLGGAERVMLTLAQGQAQAGLRVTVACPSGGTLGEAARARGIAVLDCDFERMRITADPRAYPGYLAAWWRNGARLQAYCRREQVTVIHAHHPVGVLYAARAARRLGIPVILHVHEMLPAKPLYALALRTAARRVRRFVCVSSAARALLDAVGIARERTEVVPNGVDWSFLDAAEPVVLDHRGPRIGVFGVIEPRKGQDVFLDAAVRLLARQPDARFWIVGDVALADKSGFADALRRRAMHGPLEGRVTFTGHQPAVAGWMRAMDVVALPSVAHESMGMVLIEAMTLGRPVVCSDIGVTGEIVQDGRTGRLAPIGDAQALADALADVLSSDPDAIGRRAAADMRARYHPGLFCRRIGDVYARLQVAAVSPAPAGRQSVAEPDQWSKQCPSDRS